VYESDGFRETRGQPNLKLRAFVLSQTAEFPCIIAAIARSR